MLPADLPLLQMDAVLMERLFTNPFENAAKYTPADTPLDIGAERVTDDGLPFVRVLVDDMVRPAGRDGNADLRQVHARREGIGDARHRPRLAICRAIVEAHGGKIGAFNRTAPDGHVTGARFWFTLPVETPPAAPAVPDDEPEVPGASSPSESLPDHE